MTSHSVDNQEADELSVLQGVKRSFKARCKIEVPVKRQKVSETQSLFFELSFPSSKTKAVSQATEFLLEMEGEGLSDKGRLKHQVIGEV